MSIAVHSLEPLPGVKAGLAILLLWVVLAAAAQFLAPFDPNAQDLVRLLQPPTAVHWLGTDKLGRDLLSRIIYGARIDLALCALGILAPLILGCLLGIAAGTLGGPLGLLINRLVDVLEAFPRFVLVLAIVAAIGSDIPRLYVALALAIWPAYARITREEWRRTCDSAFVGAARGLALGRLRIQLLHILPNALAPATARAPGDVARLLLMAMALGYLGIGVPPESVEWGSTIAVGQSQILVAWWIVLFPGLVGLSLALGLTWLAAGVAARLGEGR